MATGDPKEDVLQILAVVVLLFLLWLANGGTDKEKRERGILTNLGLRSSSSTNESIGPRTSEKTESDDAKIAVAAEVQIARARSIATGWPKQEYITIAAERDKKAGPINITGWHVRSDLTGQRASIGKAVTNPLTFSSNDIYLKPGERVNIVSGTSPVGYSFKVNKCMGFLGTKYSFYPKLSTSCPRLQDSKEALVVAGLSDECIEYIEGLPRCQEAKDTKGLGKSCRDYLSRNNTYEACVARHHQDSDFYLPVWYAFLDQKTDLWRDKQEIFVLLNKQGATVDRVKVGLD